MSQWYYLPIAVRLIDKDDIHGVSGVHLVSLNRTTREVEQNYAIVSNHLPNPSRFRIIVNSHDSKSKSDTVWHSADISLERKINPSFSSDISQLRSNGFSLFPHDTVQSPQYSILRLSISEADRFIGSHKSRYQNLSYASDNVTNGDSINVSSYPFNFTNSMLFANFSSTGTICTQLTSAYLSDLKYLENMVGGVVSSNRGSIGLVFGNLKKLNGDGELTVIIPWSVVWSTLGESFEQEASPSLATNVFPLVVADKSGTSWGSCVLYNSTTLITNTHVISPFITDSNATLRIHHHNQKSINISMREQIHSPFRELDLSFITLTSSQANELRHTRPIVCSTKCSVGDPVVTKGFGLFLNTKSPTIKPLYSNGFVNTVFELPQSTQDSDNIPSVIVTSSSCWNGSSGGGLFNSKDQFVGLICSNAQVFFPMSHHDVVHSDARQSEKLSKFVFVLPVELINYCYAGNPTINSQIGDLWSLKAFHKDIVLHESKL